MLEVINAMVLVVVNRYYPYFVVMVLVVVNIVVAIIGESYARVKARQSLQSDECAMTPSEILHGELTPLWYQLSRGVAQRIRCMCIRGRGGERERERESERVCGFILCGSCMHIQAFC